MTEIGTVELIFLLLLLFVAVFGLIARKLGTPYPIIMVIGGLLGTLWSRTSPRTSGLYLIPLASGLIAGEALVAVIVPLLVLLGLLHT